MALEKKELPKAVPLDSIPGYREAIAEAQSKEEAIRDMAFMDAPLDICGEPIQQLTLRHLLLLFRSKSAYFISSAEQGLERVAQFLWILSPLFVPGDAAAQQAFLDRITETIDFTKADELIEEYIGFAFMDAPAASGPKRIAIVSFVSSYVHEFASAYGWTRAQIMDEPLAVLHQQLRCIIRDRDHKTAFFNKLTDKVKKKVLKDLKKEATA